MPEFGQLVHAVPTTGMYGTDPAGGENIDIVITVSVSMYKI